MVLCYVYRSIWVWNDEHDASGGTKLRHHARGLEQDGDFPAAAASAPTSTPATTCNAYVCFDSDLRLTHDTHVSDTCTGMPPFVSQLLYEV